MIYGKGLRITNWDQLQADLADKSLTVETNIHPPIRSISFRFRRFDPDSELVVPIRGVMSGRRSEVRFGFDLKETFTNTFDDEQALLDGIISLGLSTLVKDPFQEISYTAVGVESGPWIWERTTTSKIRGRTNYINHIMRTKENRVGETPLQTMINEGEVVYVGDMVFEGTLQRGRSGDTVIYTAGDWKSELTFDPDRMAREYGNASTYAGRIVPRAFSKPG